jgi:hypothetical protein
MIEEFELLSTYLSWYIDNLKPVTLDYQLKVYAEHGYINEGRTRQQLPSFEQWKQLTTES